MPMHQGGGAPPGMQMMRSSAPVYQINASPQMVQGNSPMMMPTPSPMGGHFVPSPQQAAGVPSPGQRMGMAPSPQSGMRPAGNADQQNDDQAYLEKVRQLSKYIEPLRKMIAKIGNEDQEKLGKMKKLMDILSNPAKRLNYDVLLRCENVLEHMIRDVPQDSSVGTSGSEVSSSINPLLDSVLKLKNQRFATSSQSLNHSLYRTFGPPMEAINGPEISLPPPVKRRKKYTSSLDGETLPQHIQSEVAQLHRRFKGKKLDEENAHLFQRGLCFIVTLDSSSQGPLYPLDSIQLLCHLEDADLPSVPPISVTLGPNYPLESSPELHDNAEEYETSQFLRNVRQALSSRAKKMPARHTLTQLLTAWEMSVRSACSFKRRPGAESGKMLLGLSEIPAN